MTINPHDPENADEDIIIEDGAVVFHDFDSTSLDDVLICTDYKTRPVTLSCLRWEDHIQSHADEQNFDKPHVTITVQKPKGVFDTEFPHRELFIRQFDRDSYLYVPVDYAGSDLNASGKVVTAYRKDSLPDPNRSRQLYPEPKKTYNRTRKPRKGR